MPLPQNDWAAAVGNRLIAEQRSYNIDEQAQLATQRIPTLNQAQRSSFDAIVSAVETQSGQTFLHGPGGTGKTYVYNTLCYFLCGQGKIVLCVASSGIASLLLIGGRTSHSTFKIPIEFSTCAIARNSDLAELIRSTDLVIWEEAPMQHCHIHEAVNRTFQDIRHSDKPFGGLSIVFGGDFKQLLPVIVKGSRPQIVGACMQRSHIWHSVKVLKITENMRLKTQVEAERDFAKWQLEIGHGKHTDEAGNIKLPDHFKCTENTVDSLISTIYSGVNDLPHPPDHYFAQRTILTSRNDDVDDINEKMLREFPGEEKSFLSADSVKETNENGEGELMYLV